MKQSSFLKPFRPRALLYGLKDHVVNLYQDRTKFTPGAKNFPTPGSHISMGLYRENVKQSSCLKPQGQFP